MQSHKATRAMVLAAGVGSRLDPLTSQVPKPLVPVLNVPVIDHIFNLLAKHGITDVCANTHYLSDQIVDHCGTGERFGINLVIKPEPKLSGDAGGVRFCREFLEGGTFIVVMGDSLTDADLTSIIKTHKAKKAFASIAIKAVPHEEVSSFGVVVQNEEGFITGFQEKPKPEEALSNMISTGIYVFEPEVFNYIPKEGDYGFGRQLFPQLVKEGLPVLGIEILNYWTDVGSIQQYRESNFDALEGLVGVQRPGTRTEIDRAEVWLGEGATIEDGCIMEGTALIGKNSRIMHGASLSGRVVIGDNCVIEHHAHLHDTLVWSSTRVEANAHVENSVIGSNCIVTTGSKHVEVATVAPVLPLEACAV